MKMSNETYDVLKKIAMKYLPAFITFYATLGEIWSIPGTVAVVATLAALNVLLGECLDISTKRYNGNNTAEQ